jgi:hypothetical protein
MDFPIFHETNHPASLGYPHFESLKSPLIVKLLRELGSIVNSSQRGMYMFSCSNPRSLQFFSADKNLLSPLIHYLGVSIVMGVPQARWMVYFRENPSING